MKRKELARGRKWLAATKKSARRALGTQEGPRNTSFLESKGNRNEMARGQKWLFATMKNARRALGIQGDPRNTSFWEAR